MREMRAERRPGLAIAAALAVLATLSSAREAAAFCRTSSCPGVGTSKVCTPPEPDDCGIPIFWPTPCVSFSMQMNASKQVPLNVAEEVFETAFATWTGALCPGGGVPHIKIVNLGPVACNKHEYSQTDKAGNANIMIFRDDSWPHPGSGSTLALTTVTYNKENGEIYDADMEINSAEVELTTGDTGVKFDLRSIVTHETGHFLGLSHSTAQSAVMMAEYKQGSMDLRALSTDDKAAICAAYPPGDPIADSCDATPRHGFESKCKDDVTAEETEGCCAIAAGLEDSSASGSAPLGRTGRATLALALAALAFAARRRASVRA